VVVLSTILEYSRVLAKLAIGLDKRPELIAHLLQSDEGASQSLPEMAVMNLRPIVSSCARDARSNGKAVALYKMANLCMKILFQCKKPESIPNIYNIVVLNRRPITEYKRSERVTYLFYLGRYFHYTAQFYSAMITLEQAYLECDTRCLKQRRLILVYLVACSIILGRFPTKHLYDRPEAFGFEERFAPICRAMKIGDLATFRVLTDLNGPYADWFLYFGILFQISGRGEVTVWRSLARRTFAITSLSPNAAPTTNAKGAQVAPTLDLRHLYTVMKALAIRALSPSKRADPGIPGKRHTNWVLFESETPVDLPPLYIDPDFEGLTHEDLGITPGQLPPKVPTLERTEGMVASLIVQGLMNGYISHRLCKFAIKGARSRPALQAGWPNVASVIRERLKDEPIPGLNMMGGGTGGMTIHLSSAAPAGS
jgi:nuclear mRNA export protein PCID2/THP1